MHGIRTLVSQFGHGVGEAIYDVSVVADAARHDIVARTAVQEVGAGGAIERVVPVQPVQRVVAAVAGDCVIQTVAGAVVRGRPGQDEVFDVVGESITHTRLHRVHALVRQFSDDIGCVVRNVHVVARTARHAVGAAAAIQQIVPGQAVQRVVAGTAGEDVATLGAGQGIVVGGPNLQTGKIEHGAVGELNVVQSMRIVVCAAEPVGDGQYVLAVGVREHELVAVHIDVEVAHQHVRSE